MLMVIFGAGASCDSVANPKRFPGSDVKNFRPPLAQELFDDRPSFGQVLRDFPQCAALVGRLRRRIGEGALLESELEGYQQRAEGYPPMHRYLAAMKFYLQQTLWLCGAKWLELSDGVTNYADFLLRLDEWRYQEKEEVCIVTFNYDMLLDNAVEGTLGIPLSTVDAYVASDSYKFLKLHGSVNWGRRTSWPRYYGDASQARRALIERAAELKVSDDYVLRQPTEIPEIPGGEGAVFPAIAIPVETKSEFECPAYHLRVLDECIHQAMRILVVGWRGTERPFLERLKSLPGMAPAVQVVGLDEPGIRETKHNLGSVGLAQDRMHGVEGGFTGYLASNEFENFLSADIASWLR